MDANKLGTVLVLQKGLLVLLLAHLKSTIKFINKINTTGIEFNSRRLNRLTY